MTIKDCIDIVDNIKPNQYTIKEKVMWLSFLDEIIINEVLKTHEGYDGRYDVFEGYSEDKLSVTLIAPSPYDRIYTAYLKMKIDQENGETARYNNSMVLYNTYMTEYRKHYNKTHMPIDTIGRKDVMHPKQTTVGLSDAEYENIKRDLTYILTEYFSDSVSPDKLSAIVNDYVQNNIEMLKGKDGLNGKDGYTPKKGIDYFDGLIGPQGKSPYIGTNGNWYVWNEVTKQYDDSNISVGVGKRGTGMFSEIFNMYSLNEASGKASHAEGYGTNAMGTYTHAEGNETIAGTKGFYFNKVEFGEDTDAITVTDKQGQNASQDYSDILKQYIKTKEDGTLEYPTVSVALYTIDQVYPDCAKVLSIDGNVLTVEKLPENFKENYNPDNSYGSERKYFLWVSNSPNVGVVSVGHISHAEGDLTTASGFFGSHAEGSGSIASGDSAHAEGRATVASTKGAHAEGFYTEASGVHGSHAEGNGAKSTGDHGSHAEGYKTIASGVWGAHAEGYLSIASGFQSAHAEGHCTIASGYYGSHSEGCNTESLGRYGAHAEGDHAVALGGHGTHAEGYYTTAGMKGFYYYQIDFGTDSDKIYITDAQGDTGVKDFSDILTQYPDGAVISLVNNTKYPNCAKVISAEGNVITVEKLPFTSVVHIGSSEIDVDDYSLWVESSPTVGAVFLGYYAHSEGEKTVALERASHAEGRETIAFGQYGHAEGRKTRAGYAAHAEGLNSKATSNVSHAEGNGTEATGLQGAHAEGNGSKASGTAAHAEGDLTEVTGNYGAHAEGSCTKAGGDSAHAEGYKTVALGWTSHAEGRDTIASGDNGAHAEGRATVAAGRSQHVEGKYNVIDNANKYAHIVGGGSSDTDRKNIHTLDWDGNAEFAGTIECNGLILISPNGIKFRLTIDDNGSLATERIVI